MSNRVAILCDTELMGYDQRNPSLFQFVNQFHFYPHPLKTGVGYGNCAGYEGDPYFVKIPFRVETNPVDGIAPILNEVTVSIVAVKPGKKDFIVETKTFNTASSLLLNGVQQVNQIGTKGYISYPGDPFNSVQLINSPSYTSGTKTGYEVQYGFVLRYEYWRPIGITTPGGNQANSDLGNSIGAINNAWHNLVTNGWNLVFRFSADIVGYDGYITNFTAQSAIEVKPIGAKSDITLNYVQQTIFYDDSNTIRPSIILNGRTRIRTIFTPNGYPVPSGSKPYGTIFIDIPQTGGVFTRRFASTEIPSEAGSPFSATTNIAGASVQYADGNMRIGIFSNGIIITETYLAPVNWSATQAPSVVPRIGLQPNPGYLIDEHGNYITDEHGNRILA